MKLQAPDSPKPQVAGFHLSWRRLQQSIAEPCGFGGLLVGISLALSFAMWLYPVDFLLGTSAYWQQQDADITQYIAGFNAFAREPWQWPLLHISSINWPDGTLATFVDIIPLYAAILKFFVHGADAPFWNPYGAWILICYFLQGVGAWWICREAGIKSWITLSVLTLFLALFPALSFRVMHISLMSQWLLVFAFAVYFRSTRQNTLAWKTWTALIFSAFYINIYLFSMLSIIFAADMIRFAPRMGWRKSVLTLGVPYGLLALSLFATMLPLPPGADLKEAGFGYYSMNVLSPFAGGKLLQWPHPQGHDGQGEGFNYLGVFLLGLFIYAIALRSRHDRSFWVRHKILLTALLLVTFYALSNQIYVGTTHLFDLYLPWPGLLTGPFRVSGRFFWLAGYAVVIFTIVTVHRHAPARRTSFLLSLVLLLQIWDLGPHHLQVRAKVTQQPSTALLDKAAWDHLLGNNIKTLYFYPPFRCSKASPHSTLLSTMRYAAERKINLSTGYVARAAKPCVGYENEIASATDESIAFVFLRAEFEGIGKIEQLFGDKSSVACTEVDFAYLCKRVHKGKSEENL
jgi:hypothetical protein